MKKSYLAIGIIFLVLALDQWLKIWVKTSFCYNESRLLFGQTWAQLNFVENPGMAFGWKFGGEYGKLALSLFRLGAIGFLIYYIHSLVKRKIDNGLITSFALILAGAIGNMIDSAFYGLIFSESNFHCLEGPAKLFPEGGGYGTFLHGKVVDMLYFPIGTIPQWVPYLGGGLFFQPVFNIADTSITIGVMSILIFQRHYFSTPEPTAAPVAAPQVAVEEPVLAETDAAETAENIENAVAETPQNTTQPDTDDTNADETKPSGDVQA